MDGSTRKIAVFGVAAGLLAYPPLATLWTQGVQGVFRYLATDAFYYLAVADHSAGAAFFTFDESHPTNGFHPLWQSLLTAVFAAFEPAAEGQLRFALVAGIVVAALGTGLFALALLRLTDRAWLAWLGAVPGVYYLLFSIADRQNHAVWSFVNGMESPLTLGCFGLLVYLLIDRSLLLRPTTARLLVASSVLTLVTLSRLDDIFLFAPFLLYLVVAAPDRRQGLERAALAAVVPTLVIGAYLAYNVSYAGVALPLSGSAKSDGGVWGLLRNGYAVWTTLFPFADVRDRPGAFWSSEAWRSLQMVIPALAAVGWIARQRFRRAAESEDGSRYRGDMVSILAVYVVIKAAYNFAFVHLWHQGHWYFPASIMTFNLIVVTLAAQGLGPRTPARHSDGERSWLARIAEAQGAQAVLGVALFLLIIANGFVYAKRSGGIGLGNFKLWQQRAAIQQELDARCPGCGVVAFDDGIFAYSLTTPVMSGLGLTLDREGAQARAEGRLLDVAYARGHRWLASLNYPLPVEGDRDPESLRERLAGYQPLLDQQLDGWEFTPGYEDPNTGAAFVRFSPKGEGGSAER